MSDIAVRQLSDAEREAFLHQWRSGRHEPEWCACDPVTIEQAPRFVASDGVHRDHYGMTGQQALERLLATRACMTNPVGRSGPSCGDGGPCTA